ncbi:MAG: DUF1343 domain-containing protein [Candidatus Krumholzibacteriota bacterium]|nr:DUF1343 domain-containing protein [Candidatus Krumholzibacteriota bacterium]
MTRSGLDRIAAAGGGTLGGRRIGLLANQASVAADLRHAADILAGLPVELAALFGPQHGWRGETQANMIEWEGFRHPRLGIPVYSLYGERREPDPAWLAGLDAVVVDLFDVGARPYTFLWTAVLMARACAAAGVDLVVLDRPNPIGGRLVEGPLLSPGHESFVGLSSLPMRHGMTMAELLAMIADREGTGGAIEAVPLENWTRGMSFADTGLPWVAPSPNMPTPETALVYPGAVLFEGTNLSEGRGTTKPFELVGAPWLDADRLARDLADRGLPGVFFRPAWFEPRWDKHAGELCGGVQIHVTDGDLFRPVRCAAETIAAAAAIAPDRFRWLEGPYEYEARRLSIDTIAGGPALREAIDAGGGLDALFDGWTADEAAFAADRAPWLGYGERA